MANGTLNCRLESAATAPADLCGWNTGSGRNQLIVCNGQRVTQLYLAHCGITSLPTSFGYLKGLTFLVLNNNGLTSLPTSSLIQLTNVRATSFNGNPGLVLNNNQLTACPSAAILAKAGGTVTGNPCGHCPAAVTCPHDASSGVAAAATSRACRTARRCWI